MSEDHIPDARKKVPAVGAPVGRSVVPLAPTRAKVEALMKRCQIGVGPRQMGEAHDIMAECYGTLGALMQQVERLTNDLREGDDLRERLGDLLRRTAVALRGPEPPLTRWSWHDLPERAAAAIAAIDVMQRAAAMAADPERHNVLVRRGQGPGTAGEDRT